MLVFLCILCMVVLVSILLGLILFLGRVMLWYFVWWISRICSLLLISC